MGKSGQSRAGDAAPPNSTLGQADRSSGRKRTAKPPGGSTPRVADTGPAQKRVKKGEKGSAETVLPAPAPVMGVPPAVYGPGQQPPQALPAVHAPLPAVPPSFSLNSVSVDSGFFCPTCSRPPVKPGKEPDDEHCSCLSDARCGPP